MNDNTSNCKPAMFIDQKRARVRIYKRTLHMLGDPQFIQLLINPNNLTVAIRPAEQTDTLAHRIMRKKRSDKTSYELYSSYFIRKLKSICTNWKDGESYRLFGEIFVSENVARFDLDKALPVSFAQEEDK